MYSKLRTEFFYGNFLCLKVFKVNLKLCHYNLFPTTGANQKWSKHVFHQYMDYYSLERHGPAISVKLWQKLCGKKKFDGKWRMTAYNWLKVKLLYYSSINKLSSALCSLAICALVLEIFFCFVTSDFRESEAVSVGTFQKNSKRNAWVHSHSIMIIVSRM